jgi:hypothetical protein
MILLSLARSTICDKISTWRCSQLEFTLRINEERQ